MASPQIVTLDVSVTQAAQPSTLQQTGAMVTQGGTTGVPGSLTQVATLAALQALLATPVTITSLAWSASVVTVTTAAAHGWNSGDVVTITIAGAVPAGYNGTFQGTITGADTLTYPLVADPGSETTPGTVALGAVAELLAMGTTYFAGLGIQAPYILELGEGDVTAGVAALSTWITDHPSTVYVYLIPREWDANTDYVTLVNNYVAPNKMTYFFTTMVTGDVTGTPPATPYTGKKSVFGQVEAPAIPATEFSLASDFATVLAMNPNSTQRAQPLSYAPAYGVTPYPGFGNQTLFTQLLTADVNYIGTGAQGGLPSSNIIFSGLLQDNSQFIFWYAADWFQLQVQQALANEVINGSAPTGNPLLYNQPGINRLQNRVLNVAQQGVAAGLLNGTPTAYQLPSATFQNNYNAGLYAGQIPINAEPWSVYTQLNPSDYAVGKYAGLSAVVLPITAFLTIVFSLNITSLTVP